jgi:FAD binding domain
MVDQRVTKIRDDGLIESNLEEAAIGDFKASLQGALLRPAEAGYDDARKIWNAMIDKRPAMIACCRGAADVINAVNFARTHEILVAVRGGGHNVAGNAACDGGLMIDLSPMKSVRVDPEQRIARADLGRVRPRDPGFWAGDDRRPDFDDGNCRRHARRRLGPPRAPIRAGIRQFALGRPRHRER